MIISDDCGVDAPRVPRIYSFAAALGTKTESFGASGDFIKQAGKSGQHVFGYISYDYKNKLEKLTSRHGATNGFEDCYFMVPETIIYQKNNEWFYNDIPTPPEKLLEMLKNQYGAFPIRESMPLREIQSRTSYEKYIKSFASIQQHLLDGDIYELNYCLEFYAKEANIHPVQLSQKLRAINPAPFSAFIRHRQQYLICASPERFLHKLGQTLTAQPIKGTAPRSADPAEDAASAHRLRNSLKEQTENVMIVDLMRNDLAKNTEPGSVYVDELFGIYGFRRVYQMISTIRATLPENSDLYNILTEAFPMGSMTGCPKIKAMELIDIYEDARRGLYSGSVGYITPSGDFDWNVVIRSLQFASDTGYLSWHAGSAITTMSEPEAEYRECLLKAEAMREVVLN